MVDSADIVDVILGTTRADLSYIDFTDFLTLNTDNIAVQQTLDWSYSSPVIAELAAQEVLNIEYIIAISDQLGNTQEQSINAVITGVNDAPEANDWPNYETLPSEDNVIRVTEDQAVIVISPLENDVDIDGDALSIISASAAHGQVVINTDNTLSYTPNANYTGPDVINYQIADPAGATDSASVFIAVLPINDAPAIEGTDEEVIFVENQGTLEGQSVNYQWVNLGNNITVSDIELDERANYAGVSIKVAALSTSSTEHQFGLDASQYIINGGLVYVANTAPAQTVASMVSVDGEMTVVFDQLSTVNQSMVEDVIHAIEYRNTSENPSASVHVQWTVNDANTLGEQGQGGALSASLQQRVTLIVINDAPEASWETQQTVQTVDISEVPGPVSTIQGEQRAAQPFSGIELSAFESDQGIAQVALLIDNVVDNQQVGNEYLSLLGQAFELTSGQSEIAELLVDIIQTNTNRYLVTLTAQTFISSAEFTDILHSLTLHHDAQKATAGFRIFTLNSVTDTGGVITGQDVYGEIYRGVDTTSYADLQSYVDIIVPRVKQDAVMPEIIVETPTQSQLIRTKETQAVRLIMSETTQTPSIQTPEAPRLSMALVQVQVSAVDQSQMQSESILNAADKSANSDNFASEGLVTIILDKVERSGNNLTISIIDTLSGRLYTVTDTNGDAISPDIIRVNPITGELIIMDLSAAHSEVLLHADELDSTVETIFIQLGSSADEESSDAALSLHEDEQKSQRLEAFIEKLNQEAQASKHAQDQEVDIKRITLPNEEQDYASQLIAALGELRLGDESL